MRLTPAGFATLTHQLMVWRIPLVMVLEGGYFLDSVALDFKWVARALLGQEVPPVALEVRFFIFEGFELAILMPPLQPLNTALPSVINRIHAEYGCVYPTLAMISEIKRRLSPRDEEEVNNWLGREIVV